MGAITGNSTAYLSKEFFGGVYGFGAPGRGTVVGDKDKPTSPTGQGANPPAGAPKASSGLSRTSAEQIKRQLRSRLEGLRTQLQALQTTVGLSRKAKLAEVRAILQELKQVVGAYQSAGGSGPAPADAASPDPAAADISVSTQTASAQPVQASAASASVDPDAEFARVAQLVSDTAKALARRNGARQTDLLDEATTPPQTAVSAPANVATTGKTPDRAELADAFASAAAYLQAASSIITPAVTLSV